MSENFIQKIIEELGTDPTKLDKLFDKLTISYEKYLQKRQQLTESSAQNILKTEEELAKKIAELQAEQEKMALEKKIKAAKDKDERIKLKTEAVQKEYELQKDLSNKTFEIDKEALMKKIDLINATNAGIIDQDKLMQNLTENHKADLLKLEENFKKQKLQIVQDETDQIKKKYETLAQTVGNAFSKIGGLVGGNAGTIISKVGTTITGLESSFEKIYNNFKNGKKGSVGDIILV